MNFHQVSSDDLVYLARLEKDLFQEDAFGVFLLLHYMQNHLIFEKLIDVDDTLIGFGIITKFDPDFLNPNEKDIIDLTKNRTSEIAHLVDFAIRKEYWSMGYGSTLLLHFCKELSKKKIKTLYLEVNSNNSRALRFYTHHSFKPIGTIKSYYSNGNDAIIMVKELENF